jgi:hypothetical protein
MKNKVSKFDLVFEKALDRLNEREYVESSFEDNLKLLLKTLSDNDLLSKNRDLTAYLNDIINQPKNIKEIVLDTKEQSLPAMKLQAKQDSDSESFAVTVINLENPEEQKQFTNSMLETIFDDVIEHIKTVAMQGLSPDNAVEEMPAAEGGEAQPGAEETALPTASEEPPASAPEEENPEEEQG